MRKKIDVEVESKIYIERLIFCNEEKWKKLEMIDIGV